MNFPVYNCPRKSPGTETMYDYYLEFLNLQADLIDDADKDIIASRKPHCGEFDYDTQDHDVDNHASDLAAYMRN